MDDLNNSLPAKLQCTTKYIDKIYVELSPEIPCYTKEQIIAMGKEEFILEISRPRY
jgi:hypothetical protein